MTQVTEHLETHGVPFELIPHQQAYTSIGEARALGIDASEVLKTVAMRVAEGYALMAVPATSRLDMHLVRAALGDRHVRLATEEELLRDFPGIELGALPPLGSLLGADVVAGEGPHGVVRRSAPWPAAQARHGKLIGSGVRCPARPGTGPADQACRDDN